MLKVNESDFLARFKELVETSQNAATYNNVIFTHKDLIDRYQADLVNGVKTMVTDFFRPTPEPCDDEAEDEAVDEEAADEVEIEGIEPEAEPEAEFVQL